MTAFLLRAGAWLTTYGWLLALALFAVAVLFRLLFELRASYRTRRKFRDVIALSERKRRRG